MIQTIQNRWYQTEALNALFGYFYEKSGHPLIALPTGSGKGVVIAQFCAQILQHYPYSRIIVATHVKELVAQNYKQMLRVWPDAPAGICAAGLKRKEYNYPITFGLVKTLVNIIDVFGHVDLLLVDEAHLIGDSADAAYLRMIARLVQRNPKLKVIGFSATCFRTGMGKLTNGPIFTDIAYDICDIPGFARLFSEGFLVPPIAKKTEVQYDTSNVSMTAGDFAQKELNEITANEKVTWALLQESLKLGANRSHRLAFATGVEHSILMADMLRSLGLKAKAVHSKMPEGQRDEIIAQWLAGEIDTLTNNGIATTGIDCPMLDHIIMARPTRSVGLWVQMLGRGTRPFETIGWQKTDCLVTDHGGNARRLGTIDDPFIPKQKVKGGGDAPVKICPVCDTYNYASARQCVACGEIFDVRIGYTEKAFEGPLVRSDLPIYEKFKVDHVFYMRYMKANPQPHDNPVIKATYQCGLQRFVEFVALEAPGYGGKRAREWWRQRFPNAADPPATVNEAMLQFDKLIPPKAIEVWVNKKFPEIMAHEY